MISRLYRLLKNLKLLCREDLKERLIDQRLNSVYNSILIHGATDAVYAGRYASEIARLKRLGRYTLYPSQDVSVREVKAEMDGKLKMPYVIHDGKKLYYPKSYSLRKAEEAYLDIVDRDCILGSADPGAPHQYQGGRYQLNPGDVLVDVGCAEALFTLDNIEKVRKAILIECNHEWIRALRATFAPYRDKVEIVNRLVADSDSRKTVALATLLRDENYPAFVKMDIEGLEVAAVRSACGFLSGRDNITLACCTYHKSSDAENLAALFDSIGYEHEYSAGYMLFGRYDQPVYPYFRHAIIRAAARVS